MGYVIIDTKGKRQKETDGTLTPYFEYPKQAENYIEKRFGGSQSLRVKKVK